MPRLGLRGKVLLASAAAVVAVVLASALVSAHYFFERQLDAQLSRTQAVADALAIQLERIVSLDIPLQQLQGFDEQCDEVLTRHGGLSFAMVVDVAGTPLFRSARATTATPVLPPWPPQTDAAGRPRDAGGAIELALSPVRSAQATQVGTVVVGLPRNAIAAERDALLWRSFGIAMAALVAVLAVLYLLLSRVLVRPLGRLLVAVERMRGGDNGATVDLEGASDDEIALLGEGFNGLVRAVGQRERDLVSARDAAERANRAKSQFLAMMSHELRTPLNGVLGMAELLARSPLNDRQRKQLSHVRTSGRQLADIISDLLDLSSIESGRLRIAAAPWRLREAVEQSVDAFREAARARGLELQLTIDESLPDTIVGDAQRTQQVLANLLSNAIKFTERGSVQVSVTPAGSMLRLAVADTGIGIDAQALPHIYEAFRQLDDSLARRFGGTGLGLTIARQLVEAMHGRIDVNSRVGKGSTFWFELPLQAAAEGGADAPATDAGTAIAQPAPAWTPAPVTAQKSTPVKAAEAQAPAPAEAAAAAAPAPTALPPAPVPAPTAAAVPAPAPPPWRSASTSAPAPAPGSALAGRPLHVLLVEDSDTSRELAASCLADTGARLTVACDGPEGWRCLHADRYDAVLLDWRLPGIDGLALLAALRAHEARMQWPRTPVVAVTAHAGPGDRETCLAAGADAYLSKPYLPDQLLATLSGVLGAPQAAPAAPSA